MRSIATATFANAATISDEVNVHDAQIVGVEMPDAFDTGDLTLQAWDGQAGVFRAVYDAAGAAIKIVAGAAQQRYIALAPTVALIGLGRIKLVTSVQTNAARKVNIVLWKPGR